MNTPCADSVTSSGPVLCFCCVMQQFVANFCGSVEKHTGAQSKYTQSCMLCMQAASEDVV